MGKKPDREAIAEPAARFWDLVRRARDIAAESYGLQRDENVTKLIGFIDHVFAGETPPEELLSHVAAGFRRYLETGGRETLDNLLGAKKKAHGDSRHIPAVVDLGRNARLMVELHLLVTEKRMSVRTAAQHMENNGAGVSWTTLRNRYRDWKNIVAEAVEARKRAITEPK